VCLAVGDGANDISMIQEADVGVGINGKEGLQAAMSSDYTISQFRFLNQLLLVHGRWAYHRGSELVLNYLYKNLLWVFIIFYYQFYCGFSASLVMNITYSIYFDTVFTFFPTFLIGIFDQDLSKKTSLEIPQIYETGIKQSKFTSTRFWIYFFYAFYQSIVCYFATLVIFSDVSAGSDGKVLDGETIGSIMATFALIVINIYSTISWFNWTWITVSSFWISLFLWIIYEITFFSLAISPLYGSWLMVLGLKTFWLALLLIVALCFVPQLIFNFNMQYFNYENIDIIREIQKYISFDKSKENSLLDLTISTQAAEILEKDSITENN
jgi:phospholipid-translocating ATPase